MPRCFSSSSQSEVAWRAALRPLTVPANWIAPPNSSNFSVSVVLPASGWEMIAKVRRRATSAASGVRDGDSAAAMARSDMNRAFGRETGLDQVDRYRAYRYCAAKLQSVIARQRYRPIGQRRDAGGSRDGNHPGIDDRTRHVP